jgi:hypothetical protein
MNFFFTSSISQIKDRRLALDFEKVYLQLMRALRLVCEDKRIKAIEGGRIKCLSVMIIFDPCTPQPDGIEVRNFDKAEQLQAARVTWNSSSFASVAQECWSAKICWGIIAAFLMVQKKYKGVEAEAIRKTVEVLKSFANVQYPGYEPDDEFGVVTEEGNRPQMLRVNLKENDRSFDDLVEIEAALAETICPPAEVDGNDVGQGEFNIFIVSPKPAQTKKEIITCLDKRGLKGHYSIHRAD